jgi:hypothetical protein
MTPKVLSIPTRAAMVKRREQIKQAIRNRPKGLTIQRIALESGINYGRLNNFASAHGTIALWDMAALEAALKRLGVRI